MARLSPLRRLVPVLRPYRGQLAFGLVLVVVSAGTSSLIPWLLRAGVDGIREGRPSAQAWRIGAAMLGTALLGGAMRWGMRQLLNAISRRVETDLRDTLFSHLLTLDPGTLGRWRTGELMARLTNDLSAVRMAAGPAIMYLVNTIAGGAFALAFMLRIDARLTGLALLPMIFLPVVMVRLGRLVHDRFEAVQEYFGTVTTRVQENLSGTRVVRAYRQEDAEVARFVEANDEYARRNVALAHLNGVMNPAFGLLAGFGSAIALGVGGTLALRGTITVGAFVAFGLYLAMLTWPLIALGWVTNLFQRGAASMGRIAELLDVRPTVTTPAAPVPLPPLAPGVTGRRLTFRGVGFHFPAPPPADGGAPREPRWVLRDVSLDLPAGATLGVVGAVGSGKTALLELVPRLHDPQEGEILLDGVPLRALDLAALRREIGYVPQESLLFSETLGANIAYGLDDAAAAGEGRGGGSAREEGAPAHQVRAEPGDGALARVEEATAGVGEPTGRDLVAWAADVAHLSDTVADFPGGYDTLLGERGVNLSGGQKQRAAIARALARRPSLVLLDDALSAVDTHTEAAILRGLRTALAGRTAIIASHRISAVRDAAWILVVDQGRVVEQGTHAELVALGGRYARMVRRQQLEQDVEAADEAPALAEAAAPGAG
jgi:ATP-binding cassette subfamily B protein